MARSDTVVFLGPTLPLAEARRAYAAEYLPPAAMGDVYRVTARPPRSRPRRIAIIDGYFERMAAPWHKEILWALEQGIVVYGASSMGALRAAELAAFGMIGVGRIFEDYNSGALTDDDEVAVLHGPAERGYPVVSEAMVNVRAGVAAAVAAGLVTEATAQRLLVLAKAQFYRDRTWDSVLAAARAAQLPAPELAALAAAVAARRPDAKADDARALLRLLATDEAPARAGPRVKLSRTWFWWRLVDLMEDRG